jgi:O-antigen ligase
VNVPVESATWKCSSVQGVRQALIVMLVIGSALVVGLEAADEKWMSLAAVAAAPFMLLWPVQVTFGTFALLMPFDSIPIVVGGGRVTALTWFLGAGCILVFLVLGLIGNRLRYPTRSAICWLLFMAWGSITTLWALDQRVALKVFPTAWSLLLLYVSAVSFPLTKKQLSWATLMAVAGGTAAAVSACYLYYHGAFYYYGGGHHARGSLVSGGSATDPNYFATSLLLPISLAIGHFLSSHNWLSKIGLLIATAAMAFAVFLSMSRGTLVALIVMAFFYAYKLRMSWRLLIPVSLLLLTLIAVPESFWMRLEPANLRTGSGRTNIWVVGVAILKHYGLLGVGLNNFNTAFTDYAGYAPVFNGVFQDSHNTYLKIWAELGLVGLSLFIAALVFQLRAVGKSRSDPIHPAVLSCEAACLGLLASGCFIDLIWNKVFWLAWILLAIAARVHSGNEPSSLRVKHSQNHY